MPLDFCCHELSAFVYHELASLARELASSFIIAFYLPSQNNQHNIFAASFCSTISWFSACMHVHM
jgi:hypothetical protein